MAEFAVVEKLPFMISLVFSVNSRYLYPFLISLFSARKFVDRMSVTLFHADSDLRLDEVALIKKISSILNLELNIKVLEKPQNLPTSNGFPDVVFNKVFLVREMPVNYIWMDADTIFTKEIKSSELERVIPKEEFVISACPDPWGNQKKSKNEAVIRAREKYFNTGVLAINVENWRKLNVDAEIMRVIPQYYKLGFEWPDQCLLNYILVNHSTNLPREFNYWVSVSTSFEDMSFINIAHFAGEQKRPWLLPLNAFHRFLYLRSSYFAPPYTLYRQLEKELHLILRSANLSVLQDFKKIRLRGFKASPRLAEKFLFKYEMKPYSSIIKRIYNAWRKIKD